MKKLFISSALLAGLCTGLQAGPAVYQDNALTIGEAIIIKQNGEALYYTDVRLEATANGSYRLVEATRSPLATVEEIDVMPEAAEPPKLAVAVYGYKSLPCVDLEPLGISRKGNTFHVVIAETVLPPEAQCIAVTEPFRETFELDTTGLEAGDYVINANGVETEFELPAP